MFLLYRVLEIYFLPNFQELEIMPGTLDPLVFAKARTAEVLLMKQEIQNSQYRSAKRVFQTLPRSMRRRAASYNIRRLPIRLRQKAIEEVNESSLCAYLGQVAKDPATAQKAIKKPPCRRRSRRPKNIVESFGRRTKDKRWLETHIWHAKRARMENMWGYRIALRSNEKCRKSCIRASRNACFMYDASYYEIIEIASPFTELSQLLDSKSWEIIHTAIIDDCPSGINHWSLILRIEGTILGPAMAILSSNQNGQQTIHLIVHPLIGKHIREHFPNLSTLFGEYSIFEVEGRKFPTLCSSILRCALPVFGKGALYYCNDPRFSHPQKPDQKGNEGDATTLTRVDFWDPQINAENLTKRKTQLEINNMLALHLIPGTKLAPTEADPKMPTLILMDKGENDDIRYIVIVPNGWGMILWRSLIFNGARFGGLEERNLVFHERGRPVFPDDFPMSPAYREHAELVRATLESKWNRTPPAKRVNYQKLGISSPFHVDLSELFQSRSGSIQICRIKFKERGIPSWNARIYHNDVLIGFVTTGLYSEVQGRGVAFATCIIDDSFQLPAEVMIANYEGPRRPAIILRVII